MRNKASAIMDDEVADFDTVVRMKSIDVVMCVLELSERDTYELDEVLAMAMQVEHYITEGGTVAFDCNDSMRKFVRGE